LIIIDYIIGMSYRNTCIVVYI